MDDAEEPVAPRRSSGGKKSRGQQSASGNQQGLVIGLAVGGGGVAVLGLALMLFNRPAAQLPAPPPQQPTVAQATPTTTPQPVVAATASTTGVLPTQPSTNTAHQAAAAPSSTIQTFDKNTGIPYPQTTLPPKPGSSSAPSSLTPTPTSTEIASASGQSAPLTSTPSASTSTSASPPTKPSEKLDYEQLIAVVEPAVVRINVIGQEGSGVGSGFVVDKDGTTITNYHVITGAKKVEVEFANGTRAKALGYRVVNRQKDIAIIKIDMPPEKLTTVALANAPPGKGAEVMAFGAPLGLSFSSTKGIISALRNEEEMRDQLGADVRGNWLQTDTSISPGNSGGPLVDRYGRVVGMNTMQLASGQNLNFAVSAQDIRAELEKAPTLVKDFKPDDLQEYTKSISRKLASEEIGTERGSKLFAAVDEIFLLNATDTKTVALDASGRIWDRVIVKSKSAVEKAKIQLSFGEPSADAAVMFVILELKNSRKGTAGTQELKITAQLICADVHGKKSASPYCMVWKEEETIGTISLVALVDGTFPRQADEKLATFFTKFRSAYQKAVREQKEADDKAKATPSAEKSGEAKS